MRLTKKNRVDAGLLLLYSDTRTAVPESALLVVYLSSYAIWSKRSMYWDGELSAAKAGRAIGKPEKSGKRHGRDHENEGVDRGGGDEFDEDSLYQVHDLCPGLFDTIIADEAQKLKSPLTISHKAVVDLHATYHLFLTATPMINRPLDLLGLLSIL